MKISLKLTTANLRRLTPDQVQTSLKMLEAQADQIRKDMDRNQRLLGHLNDQIGDCVSVARLLRDIVWIGEKPVVVDSRLDETCLSSPFPQNKRFGIVRKDWNGQGVTGWTLDIYFPNTLHANTWLGPGWRRKEAIEYAKHWVVKDRVFCRQFAKDHPSLTVLKSRSKM